MPLCMAPGTSRSCVLLLPHSMPACSARLQNPELQQGAPPLSYQTHSPSFSCGFPSYLDSLCGYTAAVLFFLDICSHLRADYWGSSLLVLQHSAPKFLPVALPLVAASWLPWVAQNWEISPKLRCQGGESVICTIHRTSTLPGTCLCCSANAAGRVRRIRAVVSNSPQR